MVFNINIPNACVIVNILFDDFSCGEILNHIYIQIYREFQKMTGLPVTGELNKQTIKKMKSPRCGVRDVLRPNERPGEINTDPKKVQVKPLSNGKLKTQEIVKNNI
jgi:hypothetical protein